MPKKDALVEAARACAEYRLTIICNTQNVSDDLIRTCTNAIVEDSHVLFSADYEEMDKMLSFIVNQEQNNDC